MAYEEKNRERYGSTETYGKRSKYPEKEDTILEHLKTPKIDYIDRREREKIVVSNRLVHIDGDNIKPLRLVSNEVIGGIFDRVNFLSGRISELRANIALRKQIHDNILAEIEKDIEDRNQFLLAITDVNEKRNLKLDISVLRKERRAEGVQYWRDIVELTTELKKLEEEHEIERKIAGIFENKE